MGEFFFNKLGIFTRGLHNSYVLTLDLTVYTNVFNTPCSATTKFVNPCDGVNVGTYPQFLFCPFLFICIVIASKTLNYLTFQSFHFKRTSRRLFHQRVVCTKFDICVFYCSNDLIKYKQHVSRL